MQCLSNSRSQRIRFKKHMQAQNVAPAKLTARTPKTIHVFIDILLLSALPTAAAPTLTA
jgi:hypothetical protein